MSDFADSPSSSSFYDGPDQTSYGADSDSILGSLPPADESRLDDDDDNEDDDEDDDDDLDIHNTHNQYQDADQDQDEDEDLDPDQDQDHDQDDDQGDDDMNGDEGDEGGNDEGDEGAEEGDDDNDDLDDEGDEGDGGDEDNEGDQTINANALSAAGGHPHDGTQSAPGAGGLTGISGASAGPEAGAGTPGNADFMDVDPAAAPSTSLLPVGAAQGTQAPHPDTVLPVKIQDLAPTTPSHTKHLIAQAHEIIIPSYSVWFNISRIHENERKALPEFFNNRNKSKTPQVYKDYRDFMINTYRLNPLEYLTVTACRRNLAGDVCAIVRVHAFLEQWGLINYQVDPDTRPSSVGPAFTGHFRVTADTPRGLQPVYPAIPIPKPTPPATLANANHSLAASSSGVDKPIPTNLALSKNIFQRSQTPPPTKPRFTCSTCTVDCTLTRYHSAKPPPAGLDICANCYLDGRFPSTHYSGDFVKVVEQATKHGSDEGWTDQEDLLLLEGLEMYGEDWGRVSEHVGTRGREQCVIRFLNMPIEEGFKSGGWDLGGGDVKREDGGAAVDGGFGGLESKGVEGVLEDLAKRGVLGSGENPVLGLAAFLCGVVPRDVVEAAAKAAVEKVEEGRRKGNSESADEKKAAEASVAPRPVVADSGKGKEVVLEDVGSDAAAPSTVATTTDAMNIDQVEPPIETETEDVGSKADEGAATASSETQQTPTAMDTTDTTEQQRVKEGEQQPAAPTLTTTTAAALGAAAAKSYILAKNEETEMQKLTQQVVQLQLEKMKLKMRHFEEVEAVLEWERREVERERVAVWAGRVALARRSFGSSGGVGIPNGHG
ncbi:hypothetical protein HK097_010660, partial [Rhizophlyctis rosea]